MIAPVEPEAPNPDGLISDESRARLHSRLDELLDLQNEIALSVAANGISEATADLLQYHAERVVIRASRFAGEIAGGDTRAIAFRHAEPDSREAFVRFLNAIAEFAAPYSYATLDRGLQTFTWTDVMTVLDHMRSLEFGDTPDWLHPSEKQRARGSSYGEVREKWRAVQWVSYLAAGWAKGAKVPARTRVGEIYGVDPRTVALWVHETESIAEGPMRTRALDEAHTDGDLGRKPNFTLAPYGDEERETWLDWISHDAQRYRDVARAKKKLKKVRGMKRRSSSSSPAFSGGS